MVLPSIIAGSVIGSHLKAGRDISPFGVRIPTELKELLQAEAQKNGRSLNAEILDRLQKSFIQNDTEIQEKPTIEDFWQTYKKLQSIMEPLKEELEKEKMNNSKTK